MAAKGSTPDQTGGDRSTKTVGPRLRRLAESARLRTCWTSTAQVSFGRVNFDSDADANGRLLPGSCTP